MSKRLTTEEFIKRSNEIHHGLYDYSNSVYIDSNTPIEIECKIHGNFHQIPITHMNGSGCPECSKTSRGITRSQNSSIDMIREFKEIHGNKYDYSETIYVNSNTKMTIICPFHGKFKQTKRSHRNSYGCPICSRNKKSENMTSNIHDFIRKANRIHQYKYDYSSSVYIDSHTDICITCHEHGDFLQKPYNHLNGMGCRKCQAKLSSPETEIVQIISDRIACIQGDRTIMPDNMELDIYIPSKKIAIEFNGNYWHSQNNGKDKIYHLSKTNQCLVHGIKLIHIFEDEWIRKKDIVISRINNILGLTKYRIYARKCTIRKIIPSAKKQFLEKYHIQGNDSSSIQLGLFYKHRLVAVMTFGKNRFGINNGYELIRYCTVANFNIIGGAGKLLKYFERNWKPDMIKTYADLRWSDGNLYNQLGFKHLRNSSPNYFYVHKTDYLTRYNRINFQKHKLKHKLAEFNPSLSEWENMKMNGYDRIWDCGNMVFEKMY